VAFGTYGSKAQISLTFSDLPSIGLSYTIYEARSDSSIPGNIEDSISVGVGGIGDTYDISKAPGFNTDTFAISIQDASTSMWAANHPTADMTTLTEVLKDSAGNSTGFIHAFMKSTPSGVLIEGFTAILDTGSLFSDNFTGVYDTTHVTADVMDTVISTKYTFGYTGTDSSHFSALIAGILQFDESVDQTVDVDGSGILNNPSGGFDVLRIKVMEVTKEVQVLGIDTFPSSLDTVNYYEYWAKGIGYPVATIEMDELWKNARDVIYLNAIPVGIEDYSKAEGVDVYPNPNAGEFIVKIEADVKASMLEVYNAIGQRVLSEAIYPGQNQVDLTEQHRGIYYVVLRDEAGNMAFVSEVVKTK